jgi:hypothetical protein
MPIIKNDSRSQKNERRSPVKDKPLRMPGQSLSETLEDRNSLPSLIFPGARLSRV